MIMTKKITDIRCIDIILAGINLVFLAVIPLLLTTSEYGPLFGLGIVWSIYAAGIGILLGTIVGVTESNWYIALLSVFLGTIVGILYEACFDWSRVVEDIKEFDLDRFMTIPLIPWLIGLGIGKLIDWIRYR